MATVDKAAIAWSIAIVAVGVGIAGVGGNVGDTTQSASPAASSMMEEKSMMLEEKMTVGEDMPEAMEEVMEEAMEEMVEEVMEGEIMEEVVEEIMEEAMGPQTVSVSLPVGSAVPGCEETDSCYIPSSVTINAGDTVMWSNDDTAAHTVTSGTPAGGPDGTYDTGLFLADTTFEVTFDDSGSFDYFCMVHPWMVGNVQVN